MEQDQKKFKINCLKFILDNGIIKDGKTEFELADDVYKWSQSTTTSDLGSESFRVFPDEIDSKHILNANGIGPSGPMKEGVRGVICKINRDPERMKKLAGIRESKNTETVKDAAE